MRSIPFLVVCLGAAPACASGASLTAVSAVAASTETSGDFGHRGPKLPYAESSLYDADDDGGGVAAPRLDYAFDLASDNPGRITAPIWSASASLTPGGGFTTGPANDQFVSAIGSGDREQPEQRLTGLVRIEAAPLPGRASLPSAAPAPPPPAASQPPTCVSKPMCH